VTSVLQTTAGRMIFGRMAEAAAPAGAGADTGGGSRTGGPREESGRHPRSAAQA